VSGLIPGRTGPISSGCPRLPCGPATADVNSIVQRHYGQERMQSQLWLNGTSWPRSRYTKHRR
jgi:hypothetical protein